MHDHSWQWLPTPYFSDDTFSFVDVNGVPTTTKGLLLFNGGTVCSYNFEDTSAKAICEKMGYSSGLSYWYELEYVSWKVKNTLEVTLTDVKCPQGTWESCTYSKDVPPYCQENHNDIYLNCGGKFRSFGRWQPIKMYVWLIKNVLKSSPHIYLPWP